MALAIHGIRQRLGLSQQRFTELVYDGKLVSGALSKWEAGLAVPCEARLLRLLELAETPEESVPIVDVLKMQGVEVILPADVRLSFTAIINATREAGLKPAQFVALLKFPPVPLPVSTDFGRTGKSGSTVSLGREVDSDNSEIDGAPRGVAVNRRDGAIPVDGSEVDRQPGVPK